MASAVTIYIYIYMYTHLYVGARLKDSGKRFL